MNVQSIASGVIAAVNPMTVGSLQVSSGYTIGADGTQAPAYQDAVLLYIQVQPLSTRDIAHMDSLNVQGVLRSVYIGGTVEGVDRPAAKGGDLLTFNGQTWLVCQVFEAWPDWTRVAACLQLSP
ncbi:MAG TPA: hypothetical protein PLD10_20525 [Rhodopila sp.]|nr:hypothetical protein [Rhodopila sp.]